MNVRFVLTTRPMRENGKFRSGLLRVIVPLLIRMEAEMTAENIDFFGSHSPFDKSAAQMRLHLAGGT